MLRLKWSQQSRKDLFKIQAYIEQHNPRAAMDLRKMIEDGAERLTFTAFSFRSGRIAGTREYP